MNSTHQSSGRYYEPDAGAYGRDGAPAQNFMSALAPAHRLPSPQRANVAPSERPLPPMDRLAPQPHRGHQAPPSYVPENPFVSPLDPQLPVPKAAFLEPASPTSHSFESHSSHGLIHGESEKSPSREDFYHPGARWKDLERAKQQGSSMWLQKQSQAGSKFKTITWVVAVIALVIITGLIAKIVMKKSPPVTSPAPLKWANGATHVPTFGANSTTSAVLTDPSKSSKSDSTLPNISGASSKTASAKRHLVSLD
ncbi:hypothetical protein PCANC_21940 [Puccinia coronata f. sp. avenae]|uniref:Uncharacterized protein n=1 Tax=Puccinia coronata f. sp. avenae TaxID=200324 RepID=A0A2N5TDR2_9BASI|nr:hypothetical protein PCANC_21940 [Puccinia coronata f. sp. avenae]PLW23642.1 hypothetical protein PCASD_12364 [Puccinia coronata f. sp. avenae]PLW50138.1 hypothetical protein PCASD_01778 [Puccinia coronata f. sp. avenae]